MCALVCAQSESISFHSIPAQVVDRVLWVSIEAAVNSLRARLGLARIRSGEGGADLLNHYQVSDKGSLMSSQGGDPVGGVGVRRS